MSRFLLISLNIDAILQETTIHRRRQKLNAMTDGLGLGDAYNATLDRIKGQGGEKARLGMATLMWISHSERPLKADELLHALSVEIGSPNLNSDNIPSIGTLLSCCQGLVVINKEASTVRLIHFTLQEYLRAHPQLFGTAHSTMAETCLSYLNSQQVKALPVDPRLSDLQSTPFLEYSSLYWGVHAKRELSDCAKQLALKLFDLCSNHISARILLQTQHKLFYYNANSNRPLFSGLHWASIFGIDEIVAGLVKVEGCDINQDDCMGKPPLMRAMDNGHEGVVKLLLGRDDIDLWRWGKPMKPPLFWAAQNGHGEVVKMLLGRASINPEKPDYESRLTPLCCAAKNGHEGVVKVLLEWGINPERPGKWRQTPLYYAAENGREGVVKILLERDDVNPEKPNNWGQIPLGRAAENGHEGVVKMLLERDDVSPNKPDYDGRTPLSCAAENGHEGVVGILLRRDDVSPNEPDYKGRTPLSWAVKQGHVGVITLLQPLASTTPSTT